MTYEEIQLAQLGIVKTLAYRCLRCWYTWIPRDVEITNGEELIKLKPPRVCARCKSRLWRTMPERKSNVQPMMASIARVRSYLRQKKPLMAVNLLAYGHPKTTDRLLKILQKNLSAHDFEQIKKAVLWRMPSKRQQELETFKPPA
jgi:DNA-directed RNA polymerase subunit RPC12/RpoP